MHLQIYEKVPDFQERLHTGSLLYPRFTCHPADIVRIHLDRVSFVLSACDNGISAELLASTVLTLKSGPDRIELIDGSLNQRQIVRQDACLKVPGAGALLADAGTSEVGRSDVGSLQVEDDDLEMNARTQCSFQAGKQYRVMVKVFPEVRSRLLGMNQTNLLAFLDEIGQQAQERPLLHIEVFDIGRANPERPFHLGHPGNHLLEVCFVCDVLGHGNQRE